MRPHLKKESNPLQGMEPTFTGTDGSLK